MREVCGGYPEVVATRRSVQRLARGTEVKDDDVEVCIQPGVVELWVHPGGVQEQGVQHD